MTANRRSFDEIHQWLCLYLGRLIELDSAEVDAGLPFSSYGLSSREALELVGDLEEWMGSDCSDTVIYDYPTIDKLAAHLAAARPAISQTI
jgi:acyl carrier protein